jgi:hypothetical protein
MDNPHEDGTFWGISNFWSVWEDMCATWTLAEYGDAVVYADTNIMFNKKKILSGSQQLDFKNPFFIKFRNEKRWMRPDFVCDISFSQKNNNEQAFKDCIQIIIQNDHGITVDFDVKLLNENHRAMYEGFCSNLQKSKSRGMRSLRKNIFKSYPKLELERQKKFIQGQYESKNQTIPNVIVLFDWKYMSEKNFIHYDSKIDTDVTKQLCYEFAIKKYKLDSFVISQFVIPWFYEKSQIKKLKNDIGDYISEELLFNRVKDNQIKVYKANFSKIQEIYLTHD